MSKVENPATAPNTTTARKSVGYWADVWRRYRRKTAPMIALGYVVCLILVALFSPLIVGTKPIVCKYKGHIYFPCLGYYYDRWEPAVFVNDLIKPYYYKNLKLKDPESWAIWPLVFQDPNLRMRENERDGYPENPKGASGYPNRFNFLGTTNREGFDVFAQLVHGSRRALLVGFVSMGIAAAIGISLGALAGYFGGWIDMLLSRLIEIVMCLPTLVLIIAIISILEQTNVWHIMAIIGITSWTGIETAAASELNPAIRQGTLFID